MKLSDIPVRIANTDGQPGGAVFAVLHEVAALLDKLITDGAPGAIDLRSLPLAPHESADLEERLGRGEVHAEIGLLGASWVYETEYSGVWRVTHFDDAEQVVADTIEVDWIPQILRAHRDDVTSGRGRLRMMLAVRT